MRRRSHVLRIRNGRSCRAAVVVLAALLMGACGDGTRSATTRSTAVDEPGGAPLTPEPGSAVERLRVNVRARYPHDPAAFTQGLAVADGAVFEGTGLVGASEVRRVELSSGRVLQRARLAEPWFGEGIAIDGNRLLQLTWQDGVAVEYDRERLRRVRTIDYVGEGWGLCRADVGWVMSDGSEVLAVRDPRTFAVRREVRVRMGATPVRWLNELECVGEHVYANVWKTDQIVRIRLSDGSVDALIDARGLPDVPTSDPEAVLNGIAALPDAGRFLITGKRWPAIFEVTFTPAG